MTNIIKQISVTLFTIGIVFALAFWLFTVTNFSYGSAPSGLNTLGQIATTTQVGPDVAVELFSEKRSCSSRVIGTTVDNSIMLIFFDPFNGDISSTTLSSSIGFPQATSTTVAYDGGIYGCGRVFGFATASTTISLLEFR